MLRIAYVNGRYLPGHRAVINIEDLGYQITTPKEAREILGLKGADRVKF